MVVLLAYYLNINYDNEVVVDMKKYGENKKFMGRNTDSNRKIYITVRN